MATLLLEAWGREHESARGSREALQSAFAPAVRLHLLDAYGWFLLATLRATRLPDKPPHHSRDLPELGAGIAEPPELEEYRALESAGWLSQLQAQLPSGIAPENKPNILAMASSYPHLKEYQQWRGAFSDLFARMTDSLDEN
mgnify:FL=1